MRIHASHPQLHTVEVISTAYVFTCPGCADEYYVRSAHVQPDGTLRCYRCSEKEPTPNGRSLRPVFHHWCPQCRQAKKDEDCEGTWPRHRGRWCLDCGAAETTGQPVTKTCQHCGDGFTPKRRDARYCSTRCRTAAHRTA